MDVRLVDGDPCGVLDDLLAGSYDPVCVVCVRACVRACARACVFVALLLSHMSSCNTEESPCPRTTRYRGRGRRAPTRRGRIVLCCASLWSLCWRCVRVRGRHWRCCAACVFRPQCGLRSQPDWCPVQPCFAGESIRAQIALGRMQASGQMCGFSIAVQMRSLLLDSVGSTSIPSSDSWSQYWSGQRSDMRLLQ